MFRAIFMADESAFIGTYRRFLGALCTADPWDFLLGEDFFDGFAAIPAPDCARIAADCQMPSACPPFSHSPIPPFSCVIAAGFFFVHLDLILLATGVSLSKIFAKPFGSEDCLCDTT